MKSYLLHPVRGRDRTDKKIDRTVSPINDNIDKKRAVTGGVNKIIERSPIVSRSIGQSISQKPKIKIVDKDNNRTHSPEANDISFEEEEKRIRRENLMKEFAMILAKKAEAVESEANVYFFDALRRSHKVYDVYLSYALELRGTSLKTSFLKMWKKATEKHKFRSKLIKNFVRNIERVCKGKFEEVYEDTFRKVKATKRLPHSRVSKKPAIPSNLNKTSGSTGPYNSNVHTLNISKEAALQKSPQRNSPKKSVNIESRAIVGSSHSNLKKASTNTSRNLKQKPDEIVKIQDPPIKKENIIPRSVTPVRPTKTKQEPKSSKLAKKESPTKIEAPASSQKMKDRHHIKILNSSVDDTISKKSIVSRTEGMKALSRSTDRNLGDDMKISVGNLIPKLKINSMVPPRNGLVQIEKSKSQTSTTTAQSSVIDVIDTTVNTEKNRIIQPDKNLFHDKVVVQIEEKYPDANSAQPTQQNMISRHQDMKNRLLEQIRAREAEDDEEYEGSDDSEHASVHRPVPSPIPENSHLIRSPENNQQPTSGNANYSLSGSGYLTSQECTKPVNQSIVSENASTKVSIHDAGNMSHASIKQRYLDEIQAFKANHSALLNLPKSKEKEKPNIFFNSLTDRSKDEHIEEELDSILDPKIEQKLFRLQYRKAFRTKA